MEVTFEKVREGDEVLRLLAGQIPVRLKVTRITEELIICGPWKFDRITGIEIDEDIPIPISHLTWNN